MASSASSASHRPTSAPTQALLPDSGLLLYRTPDGVVRVSCRLEGETVWLNQRRLAELYPLGVGTLNHPIKAIFAEGELSPEATLRRYRIVQDEGSREITREVDHFSLPMILAVGFRVRSPRGTQFRQWALERLGEYLTKGFTLDDARLRAPPGPGVPDYFDELLERIRDIRASERRMYLRVREIFALAADYTPDDSTTSKVFQVIQNKLHFAATGHTAPELIAARAQADAPNMGLTSWRGAQVLKSVVVNVCDAPDLSAALRLCAR